MSAAKRKTKSIHPVAAYAFMPEDVFEKVWKGMNKDPSSLFLCCGVSREWRDGIEKLGVWVPVIAPPGWFTIDAFVKDTTPHDRRRWFGKWVQWCCRRQLYLNILAERFDYEAATKKQVQMREKRVEKIQLSLLTMNSDLDGWMALAPFHRAGSGESPAWLSRMVKLADPGVGWPRSQRPRRTAAKVDTDRRFFQVRVRDDDEAFRVFRSKAVHEYLERLARKKKKKKKKKKKMVFTMVNVHGDEDLSHHWEHSEATVLLASTLLQIYLPNMDILPKYNTSLHKRDVHLNTPLLRECYTRAMDDEVVQFDAPNFVEDRCQDWEGTDEGYMYSIYLFAPDMYDGGTSDMSWMFSCPLEEGRGWCVSSHMFQTHSGPKGLMRTLVYCALHGAHLGVCENSSCIMNNTDGVDEDMRCSALLCPACLRMLQLSGALPDVDRALSELFNFFTSRSMEDMDCAKELKVLQDGGVWQVTHKVKVSTSGPELGFVPEEHDFEYEQ